MERRSFLKWATNGLGVLFAAVLGAPAIAYLIDPRNRPALAGDFKPVVRLEELKIDEPAQFVIRDLRRDAWTLHPNDVIGRVWLIRDNEKDVRAYTTICPHLGCSINLIGKRFVCPCHRGNFHLSGERVSDKDLGYANPVPRGMDLLDCEGVPDPKTGEPMIAVKYENFYQGIAEKKCKS